MFTGVFQELLQVLAAMSLHPAGLHWSHSLSSQGDSTGVRQLLCSLGLCSVSEAAASSQLLCTSNLTRTPGWPVTRLGLELQGVPKKGKPLLPGRETGLESQEAACGETLPCPLWGSP